MPPAAAEAAPAGPAVERILAVKLADLGDALTATPALRALRSTWSTAIIDVLTSPAGAEALAGLDSIDRIWTADKHQFDSPAGLASVRAWRELMPLLAQLRRRRYDRLLLLHHLTTRFGAAKYALLARLIGASMTVGLDNGRGRFLNVRVPDHGFGELHEVEYGLRVAEAAGARQLAHPRLEMVVGLAAEERALGLLAPDFPHEAPSSRRPDTLVATRRRRRPRQRFIALHPGGGSFSLARRWSVAGFAEVGRRLAKSVGARPVLIGTNVDAEPASELARVLDGLALNLVGQTSVKETAAALRRCLLLVSNDSGVVHLAAAVGTPVVAIFGPSNDRAWGPYPHGEHRVVRATLPCSPCFYRGKSLGTPQGCPTRDCLQLVTPEMVLAAAEDLLSRRAAA